MSYWICAVPGCKNNSNNCPVSFKHDFPKSMELKRRWMKACGLSQFPPQKYKVCRDHFRETDYSNRGLKGGVLPSKNLPEKSDSPSFQTEILTPKEESDGYLSDQTIEELKAAARNSSTKVMLHKNDFTNGMTMNGNGTKRFLDLENVTPCKVLKMSEAKPPKKLPTITQSIILLMNTDPYKYMGLTPDIVDLVEIISSNLSIAEINIILTFRKLKLDEDFSVLDDYFDLSEGEAKQLFRYTITAISKYMKALITSPSMYAVFQDIPVSHRRKLCQTRAYLSSFSIKIEKTTDFYTNEVTYNGRDHVIHYFYLVTPDGYIQYISPGYGGRLSPDKLLPFCKSVHPILEDGFNVIDIIPEFNENQYNPKKFLTFEQQVCYETMKRIREFSLISNKKPLSKDLAKNVDKIVIAVVALTNLQAVNYENDGEEESNDELFPNGLFKTDVNS
uniref:CSON002063 protein n=1 Tax=Culicoides sonorensis TaxID=179676 RepID=A0A336MKQ9_CULSO